MEDDISYMIDVCLNGVNKIIITNKIFKYFA